MPAHQRVRAWIAQNYQKPVIDQEWLADCSDWITSEFGLEPIKDFDRFIQHVEAQLLQSNLADSTVPGSGIDPLLVASDPHPARPRPSVARRPSRQAPRQTKTTGPIPLLVEIKSVTEIAHSAFSLLNTHQTRLDRADLGLAQEENAEQPYDEDEGPVPRFPRGMLRLELSDGSTTFRAIEFRSLPQLELGTTPLGYKMFLKSTPIRNSIAFLEPENVILKGYRTEDHDINSEQVFLSSLRKRLGRPDPPPEVPAIVQPPAQPAPAQPTRQHQPPPAAQPPSTTADSDDMYGVDPDVLREMAIQMDDEMDMYENQRPGIRAPIPARSPLSKEKHATGPSSKPRQNLQKSNITTSSSSVKTSSTSSVKTSHYFTANSAEPESIPDVGLSPRPAPPPKLKLDFDITWDTDDPESSKLPVTTVGSTSARLPSNVPLTPAVPEQWQSPDPYDDLSFDMNVDELDLERLDMIEQRALGTGANNKGKGKSKDDGTEGMTSHSRPSVAPAKKTPSGSVLGTKQLALCPVSLSGAEASTRTHSRATSASSLNGSVEFPIAQSTQSSGRRLLRDPSLIVISSEDEAPGGHDKGRPRNLARRPAKKARQMDRNEDPDWSDIINISD